MKQKRLLALPLLGCLLISACSPAFWNGFAQGAFMGMSSFNTPTYTAPYGSARTAPSTSTYSYGDGADAAISNANRIMQQSEARLQYEMANAPQQLMQQTAQQMAAQEAAKEAQWRRDYENYKINPGYMLNEDGSLLTWEQYKNRRKQIEAQAWMEQNGNNHKSKKQSESSREKKWQSQSTESDCQHCAVPGNGKCKTCGGDGLMDSGFGLGVNTLKCSSCYNQNGKCRWCNGTGKLSKTKMVYE